MLDHFLKVTARIGEIRREFPDKLQEGVERSNSDFIESITPSRLGNEITLKPKGHPIMHSITFHPSARYAPIWTFKMHSKPNKNKPRAEIDKERLKTILENAGYIVNDHVEKKLSAIVIKRRKRGGMGAPPFFTHGSIDVGQTRRGKYVREIEMMGENVESLARLILGAVKVEK